jgi:hypothetical protein
MMGVGELSSRNKTGDEKTSLTPTGERLSLPFPSKLKGEGGGGREACEENRRLTISSWCSSFKSFVATFILNNSSSAN